MSFIRYSRHFSNFDCCFEIFTLIIFRYLSRELFSTVFAVTSVLLLILIGNRLIRQLAMAAEGEIPLEVVMYTVYLRLPSLLEMILPLALFMGILLAYGRLYAESEMTVLTATGFSENKLLKYTLILATAIAGLVGFFSLYLTPLGAEKLEQVLQKQASMTEFEMISPGRFQSTKRGKRFTYTESLNDNKTIMQNVFIADGDTLILAKEGTQRVDAYTGERFLELHNGTKYNLVPGQAEAEVLEFSMYGVKISEQTTSRKKLRVEAVPTSQLLNSDKVKYQGQLQWRLSLIIMIPICALIALPLSKVNPRQGKFARMVPGIILFMLYLTLVISVTGMVEKGRLIPMIGIWPVHLIYLSIGLFLLYFPEFKRRRLLAKQLKLAAQIKQTEGRA